MLVIALVTVFGKVSFDTADDLGVVTSMWNLDDHVQVIGEYHDIGDIKRKEPLGIAKTLSE
jgi:hypothetical protein